MSPLLLAVTEAAGHAAAETGIVEKFGIEPKYIIMQAVSFLILFAVIYKFGIKPTISTMEERNAKIDTGLKYAEEMKTKLDAAQQQSAEIIKQAQVKAGEIINEARASAKDFLDKQTQEATQKANDLLTKAQQAIELERRKTLAEAREEIARLVVATTERVLAKKLSDADRAAYNETAAKELAVI
ncbi:MAG: F0F1 ATP synthase subunit B [Opitutaceae bacterium]|nr:F0F1 ATP synthase subunit B [Opitutaceae bacterium]